MDICPDGRVNLLGMIIAMQVTINRCAFTDRGVRCRRRRWIFSRPPYIGAKILNNLGVGDTLWQHFHDRPSNLCATACERASCGRSHELTGNSQNWKKEMTGSDVCLKELLPLSTLLFVWGFKVTLLYSTSMFLSRCPGWLIAGYNRCMDRPENEPKKILFLITKSSWGGAQQYVYDIATNLPKDGFEAVVAGGGNGALFAKLRDAGIRTISLSGLQRDVALLGEWRAFLGILRLLKKERPDIVHLNSPKAAGLGATAVFVFKLLNFFTFKPAVVFTIHGWPFREDRPLFQRAVIFLISWITCMLCDRVVLINTSDYEAAKRFLPKRKLALISNGLAPLSFFSRQDARLFFGEKTGHLLSSETVVIGTIAELTKNKGLIYLIEVLSRLNLDNYRGLTLIIILGEGEDRPVLEKSIADAGLQERVFLLGFVPDAARFLPGFDIFVLPSLKEGLPYALMAAMSAGIPAIASRVGGIPDLITNGETGLLTEPKDAKSLGEVLHRLLVSPDMRERLGSAARKKTETNFLFSAMMQATISLYHDSRTAQ